MSHSPEQMLSCSYNICSYGQTSIFCAIPGRPSWPNSHVQSIFSFCANSLYSLIMRLIVSSTSPHNLHLLFCCILSILAQILLIFMALFCTAIRRDSVSLLRFPILSHVHVFSCEMSLVSR